MRRGILTAIMAAIALIGLVASTAHVAAARQAVILEGQTRSADPTKAVPGQLSYQGFLANAGDSSAMDATLEMTFRIYDSETKGAELWSETHAMVSVANGLFEVLLGSQSAFPSGLFDGTAMWLQTEIGAEVLVPRKPVVSTAYSHRANSAEMLLDYTLTDLDDRWVNEDQPNSISSAMINDLEIVDADISTAAAIDPSKVAGTAWTGDNDGAGSGLDADLLDGQEAAAFLTTTSDHGRSGVAADLYEGATTLSDKYVNQNDLDHLDAADGDPADAVYVDNDGRVGIGTTGPAHLLDVNGSVNAATYFGDGSNLTGVSGTSDGDWTISGSDLYSAVSGNVGVGITTPERKLHIYGGSAGSVTSNSTAELVLEDDDDVSINFLTPNSESAGFQFGDPEDSAIGWIFYDHVGNKLRFATNNSNRMTILSDGKVGIGTDAPDYHLDVNGSAGLNEYLYHNEDANTYLRFLNDQINLVSGGAWLLTLREGTQDEVVINDGSTDVDFRVKSNTSDHALFVRGSDGDVGIGVSDPDQELHIRSGAAWMTPLVDGSYLGGWVLGGYNDGVDEKYFAVWSDGEKLVLGKSNDQASQLTHNLQIRRDGNVGIGKSPSCRLEVSTPSDTAAHFRTSWAHLNAIGCYGEATPGTNSHAKGVYGKCVASDGYGYGVYGRGGYTGTYGSVSESGVSGYYYYGSRGYAYISSANGNVYGVYGYGGGGATHYGVYYSGGLGGSGTKSAIVRTEEGPMAVYCQESPENWFEDFGSGEIQGGRAEIQLAGDFRLTVTINNRHPMKVFITPNADIGRWWVEKDDAGFILMAPDAPQGARFDYRVVAKRKGYEDIRLERTPAAYTDHFLYPDIAEVPPQYREEWIRSASPDVQAQYGLTTPSSLPAEEDIPVTTKDSSLKKAR